MSEASESRQVLDLIVPAVEAGEEILAEGRAHVVGPRDGPRDRVALVVTERRILYRLVAAAYDHDPAALREIALGSIAHAREGESHGRCYVELTLQRRSRFRRSRPVVLQFSRPDGSAAAALRRRLHELAIPYEIVDYGPAAEAAGWERSRPNRGRQELRPKP